MFTLNGQRAGWPHYPSREGYAALSLGRLLFLLFLGLVRPFIVTLVGKLAVMTRLIRLFIASVGLIPKILLRLVSLFLLLLLVHLIITSLN